MTHTETRPIRSASPQLGLDPEIGFKVEGVVFGIPRSQLLVSEFFRDMLKSEHIGSPDEGTKEKPIVLDAVSLSQQWSEALHLATSWGFEHLRTYIIQVLDSLAQDPLDRIQIADECGLTEWLHPAYAKLCARAAPLTAEEGRRLGFERFAALGWIRETELKQRHDLAWCNKDCCRPLFELDSTEKGFEAWVALQEALNTHIPPVGTPGMSPVPPPMTPEAGGI